jgi:EAL domain-containing protein (putative c-di-GMP-specific phosphodiesterase class I)/GGDEF domain-containing protein
VPTAAFAAGAAAGSWTIGLTSAALALGGLGLTLVANRSVRAQLREAYAWAAAAQRRVADSEMVFASAIDASPLALTLHPAATDSAPLRQSAARRELGARLGSTGAEALARCEMAAARALIATHRGEQTVARDVPLPDGQLARLSLHSTVVRDAVGEPRLVITQVDSAGLAASADHAAAEARLAERVGAALRRAAGGSGTTALLLVGIDRFRSLEASVGVQEMGRVARQTRERLSRMTGALSVDELEEGAFAVLVDDAGTEATLALAARAVQVVGRPLRVAGRPVVLSACVGIATTSRAPTVTALIGDARHALDVARRAGPAQVHLAQEGERESALTDMLLAGDLAEAVGREQLRLHYQPIVDLDDGRVVGVEALVRWEHPDFGLLTPGRFLPLAERTETMPEIGAWVLEAACREATGWGAIVPGPLPTLTVNVSPTELADQAYLSRVRSVLGRTSMPPDQLCLELSELSAPGELGAAEDGLREVGRTGVLMAIDDFGIGYSSLERLRQMPDAALLKLDRSFVERIAGDHRHREIVAAVTALSARLDVTLIAEGIETPAQMETVMRVGCGYGQGYLFARPLDSDALHALLASQPPAGRRAGRRFDRRLRAVAAS